MTGHRNHTVAGLEAGDTLTHRFDNTRNLATRRKGARRLDLVFVLDDQHIGKIDRARLDRDEQLARPRDGIGQVAHHQRLGSAHARRK
jgi:hypothetical protein